jgi:hypothetical protein
MPSFNPCVTKVGGCFEKALQMHLAVRRGKSTHDPLSCGVTNRAELMEWHKQHRAVSPNSPITVTGSDTCRRDSRSQVEHLGTGATVKREAINEHTLSTTSVISIPNFSDLHDTFSKMMLLDNAAMDQVLWSVSEVCAGLDADVVGAIVKALLAVQRRLPHPDKMKQNFALEPISLKLCILQHSLYATASLLRVSGILQVRKKLPS